MCVGVSFDCSKMASQVIRLESEERLKQQRSHIDVVVGSINDTMLAQKLSTMQQLQMEKFRVWVDYSDDVHTHVTEDFLSENQVKFVLVLEPDSKRIQMTDRLSMSNEAPSGGITVSTELKQLIMEMQMAMTRSLRERSIHKCHTLETLGEGSM